MSAGQLRKATFALAVFLLLMLVSEKKALSPYIMLSNDPNDVARNNTSTMLSPNPFQHSSGTTTPVNYTRGFVKFNKTMTNFPTPVFHGCNAKGLCKMSNVCYSTDDNMLIFDTPGGVNYSAWFPSPWGKVTGPRKGRIVSYQEYSKFQNVYFTKRYV